MPNTSKPVTDAQRQASVDEINKAAASRAFREAGGTPYKIVKHDADHYRTEALPPEEWKD